MATAISGRQERPAATSYDFGPPIVTFGDAPTGDDPFAGMTKVAHFPAGGGTGTDPITGLPGNGPSGDVYVWQDKDGKYYYSGDGRSAAPASPTPLEMTPEKAAIIKQRQTTGQQWDAEHAASQNAAFDRFGKLALGAFAGTVGLASAFGGGSLSSLLGGSSSPVGWTSGYDLAGGGALGDVGGITSGSAFYNNPQAVLSSTTGDAGWTSGYDLPMGDMSSWGTPNLAPGVDKIGSDWATSGINADGTINSSVMNGGMLPTNAAGYTLPNLQAASGVPGSVNSGLPDLSSGSALQRIMQGSGSAKDLMSLLGPALSIGSGVYGMGLAKDLSAGVNGDASAALSKLGGLNIDTSKLPTNTSIDLSGIPTKSPMDISGIPTNIGLDLSGIPTNVSLQTTGLPNTDAAAKAAIAAADPWGTSGGRALADEQLQALMRDPSQVAANDPAYKLRIQAAQRAMGSYGQDSGAMAVAGANASTDWLNNRQASLANLENMGNPVGAQQVGLGVGQLGLGQGQLALATGQSAADTALRQGNLTLSGRQAQAGTALNQGQLSLQAQQLLSSMGLQYGQLGLAGQQAKANTALAQGGLTLQGEQAKANLGLAQGGLGMDAARLKLAAQIASNQQAGQSLASIGYGATRATGGDTGFSPSTLAMLQQLASTSGLGGSSAGWSNVLSRIGGGSTDPWAAAGGYGNPNNPYLTGNV